MFFIHFIKLTEQTVSFISVSNNCKNCTVTPLWNTVHNICFILWERFYWE